MRFESTQGDPKSFAHGTQNERGCDVPGCEHAGEHRAPKSPDHLNEYYWFCLGHVRDFNKQWDYFDGMSGAQIEDFMKDAVTGHRPTWKREDVLAHTTDRLHDAIDRFLGRTVPRRPRPDEKPLSQKEHKALALMDMVTPFTMAELKTRYKQLVKQHHPDVNPGNRMAEERFKSITAAYALLSKRVAE